MFLPRFVFCLFFSTTFLLPRYVWHGRHGIGTGRIATELNLSRIPEPFADERQEQAFTVKGGLLWFHHVLIAAVEVAGGRQVGIL